MTTEQHAALAEIEQRQRQHQRRRPRTEDSAEAWAAWMQAGSDLNAARTKLLERPARRPIVDQDALF